MAKHSRSGCSQSTELGYSRAIMTSSALPTRWRSVTTSIWLAASASWRWDPSSICPECVSASIFGIVRRHMMRRNPAVKRDAKTSAWFQTAVPYGDVLKFLLVVCWVSLQPMLLSPQDCPALKDD